MESKKFFLYPYIIIGISIVAMGLVVYIPAMQMASGSVWVQQHQEKYNDVIKVAEQEGLCTAAMLHKAVEKEINPDDVKDLHGRILILEYTSDSPNRGTLEVSPIGPRFSEKQLAGDASQVEILIIYGRPGPLLVAVPSGQGNLVAPVLIYQWPDRNLIASGRLDLGGSTSDSRLEVGKRLASKIQQLFPESAM